MNINTEKLAIHLAQMKLVEITADEMKVSNKVAVSTVFSKSKEDKLEIIEDLKEDYDNLVNHYKKIIEQFET